MVISQGTEEKHLMPKYSRKFQFRGGTNELIERINSTHCFISLAINMKKKPKSKKLNTAR